jgi:hypothetical protein
MLATAANSGNTTHMHEIIEKLEGCNMWNALHLSMRHNALPIIADYNQHDGVLQEAPVVKLYA